MLESYLAASSLYLSPTMTKEKLAADYIKNLENSKMASLSKNRQSKIRKQHIFFGPSPRLIKSQELVVLGQPFSAFCMLEDI